VGQGLDGRQVPRDATGAHEETVQPPSRPLKIYRVMGPAGLAHKMLRMTAEAKEVAMIWVLGSESQGSVAAPPWVCLTTAHPF
jgi:hypothetical protein